MLGIQSLKIKKRERIAALDLLRGLFLIVIICDHIAWTPSLLFQFVTSNTGSFASAAEGFFAISGILVGYIYGPRFINHIADTTKKIWRRAGLLYILSIFFTLAYTFWSMLLDQPYPRLAWVDQSTWQLLISTVTLQHTYGLTDFLARYAVFMLFAPAALWLIVKHKAWLLALGSIVTWYVFHERTLFSPYATWQSIFMIAIIIGYYLPVIEAWLKQRLIVRRVVVWTAVATFAIVAIWSIVPNFLMFIGAESLSAGMLQRLQSIELARQLFIVGHFDKDSLELGRLAVGCLWFAGLYLIFRKFETPINSTTKGYLQKLGQYSLLVYCLQAFFIFLMDVTIPIPLWTNIIINTIVNILLVMLIYGVVAYYDKYKKSKAKDSAYNST